MTLRAARPRPNAGHPRPQRRAAPLCLASALSFLLYPFSLLLAQSPTTGAISGRVLDLLGHPIPGAQITLTNPLQGQVVDLRSTASGDFLAPSLPPSQYIVDIQSPGARPLHLANVSVRIGSTSRVNATLTLLRPTAHSTVTVDADAPDLDDPSAATSAVLSPEQIAHLPTDGRTWQSFALLTPEANPASTTGELGLLSFRGIAPTQNSSRIDGADDDQSFNASPHGSGTDSGPEAETEDEAESSSAASGRTFSSGSGAGPRPGAPYTFSQTAVREFRVGSQSYSAMYGHAAGGIIATVSKSGTGTFHGSAFYLLRESAFAAANPFSVVTHYTAGTVSSSLVKPTDQRHQFGATLGGPILPARYPHHFFFFYALDVQRRSFPAISSPENPAFFNLSATQRALLASRGVSSAKISAALTYLDSLTGSVPRGADQTVNFLKLDDHLSPHHQLSLQYNRSRFSSPSGLRSAPVVNRATHSFGSQNIDVDSVLVRSLYSRRSSFSNELRLHLNRDLHSEQPQTPLPQEPSTGPGGLSPEVAIGPQGFIFGTPASVGRRAAPDERRVELADMASLVRGRHLLQTGVDYSYVHDRTDSLTNAAGTFHYDSAATSGHAGGLADWITDYTFNVNTYPNGGCPSISSPVHYFCFRSFSQSFGQQTSDFSTQQFAAFVQDRWRPTQTLSITAGLRFEYELLPIPQQPNPLLDAIFSRRGATSIFPEDRNNFGPRVATAWQPFGERGGILRIAYGLYFGRLPGATVRSALLDTATPSSATRVRILPTTVTPCPQTSSSLFAQGFGYPCSYTSAPPSGVSSTTSATVFDRRFRLPAIQQGSLSLERDLGHVLTLTASYLLNLNRQLANSVDLNIAPSTGTRTFQLQGGAGAAGIRDGQTFILPVYTQRITSSFGPVTAITSNANGTYNALVLQAVHRRGNGLQFHASWTWSKAIDFGQNIGSVPRTNSQLDPFDIRFDKGLSALNVPHKLVVSAVWQPRTPALPSRLLQRLSQGWLFAPVLSESSGRPYTYNIFGGARLSGGRESINGSGGELYLPTIGRNTLRLPDTFHLDLRLSRELSFKEKVHLRAIAEAFNLTNHVNYSSITQRAFLVGAPLNGLTPLTFQDAATVASEGINTSPFGAFTSSSSPQAGERQVQFGLNLDF